MAKKDTKIVKEKEKKNKVKVGSSKKKVNNVTDKGRVYVTSTFNNTLITVTNDKGDTLGWSSSGAKGFRGTRKSTPYAASLAAEDVVKRIVEKGLKSVDIFIKGPGNGRDSSLRGIRTAGVVINSISDITPMPHNGPRAKKKRRV
jgi:small subunit ribosomal protein S11